MKNPFNILRTKHMIKYLEKKRKEFTESVSYSHYSEMSEFEKYKYNASVDVFDKLINELKNEMK